MANNTVTLTATGTATLTPRWNCVEVTNTNATAVVWVSTNGVSPSGTGANDGEVAVAPNSSQVFTNQLPMWSQAQTVMRAGTQTGYAAGFGTNPGMPQEVFPSYQPLNGGVANPGTVVKINTSGTSAVIIAGCG